MQHIRVAFFQECENNGARAGLGSKAQEGLLFTSGRGRLLADCETPAASNMIFQRGHLLYGQMKGAVMANLFFPGWDGTRFSTCPHFLNPHSSDIDA